MTKLWKEENSFAMKWHNYEMMHDEINNYEITKLWNGHYELTDYEKRDYEMTVSPSNKCKS